MSPKLMQIIPVAEDSLILSVNSANRILRLLDFFFKAVEESIHLLSENRFSQFDAQVSENMCQVRAYMIYMLAHRLDENTYSLTVEKIKKARKICVNLINKNLRRRKKIFLENDQVKMCDFLSANQLDLVIPKNILFASQMYILSRYKVDGEYFISKGIDYPKLMNDCLLNTKTYLKKFIHKLQRNISNLSTKYVIGVSRSVNCNKQISALRYLSYKDEIGRDIVACYEATKILMKHTNSEERRVNLRVYRYGSNGADEINFNLVAKKGSDKYVFEELETAENKIFLSFIGVCDYGDNGLDSRLEYIEKFCTVGFEDIILFNMAQHSQYSGRRLLGMKENPYASITLNEKLAQSDLEFFEKREIEFLEARINADKKGCSSSNKSLFFLTHVMCLDGLTEPVYELESAC